MNSTFWLELLPIWINWMLLNLISHWPYATIQQQCDRWCDAANSSDVWVGLSSIFCCSFYFISFVVLISASRYNYNMMRSNTPKPLITDSRADASESALAFNMQCSLFLSLGILLWDWMSAREHPRSLHNIVRRISLMQKCIHPYFIIKFMHFPFCSLNPFRSQPLQCERAWM